MYEILSCGGVSARIRDFQSYRIGGLQFPQTFLPPWPMFSFLTSSILKAAENKPVITRAAGAAEEEICMKHTAAESSIASKVH